MKKSSSDSRGFTLLESMMALLILAVGLLGLAQLFILAVNQNSYSRQNTMAISVAVDKLEELRNQYNNDLITGGTSPDLSTGSHGPATVSITGSAGTTEGTYQYQVSWTVTAAGGREKDITVTADPVSSNVRQNRSVQLSAHLAP